MTWALMAAVGASAGPSPGSAPGVSPEPLFQYRVLAQSFRNAPTNTPERVAADLRQFVPDDIRRWTAISLVLSAAGYNYLGGDTPLEFCKRFDRQGYRFFIEIADPGIPDPPERRIFLRPEQIREIFLACPNCIGAETGETFWAFTGGDNARSDQWLLDVLRVCAENRRWFILGEGTWNKGHWTRFFFKHHDALRADGIGRWLVAMHKNTKPWATLQNMAALQGAWMTGLVGNHGLWNDQWAWTYSSFGDANQFPPYNKADHNERKIPFQNLIFGKREGRDRFWFQANGYHGDGVTLGQRYQCAPKPTVITFTCRRQPRVAVEDGREGRMRIVTPWDAGTGRTTLSLDHADGAVNFTVGCAP